eukprot:SAG31_NODE_23709_length_498_cov_0.776942_1_plen_132_part_10
MNACCMMMMPYTCTRACNSELWSLSDSELRSSLVLACAGSYGAAPRCVLKAQDDFRAAQNANPDIWLSDELPRLMGAARKAVADLCGGCAENYCLVDNATTGASTVALMIARRFMSGEYQPGDIILVHRWMY